ncbi:hypothetical protein VO56_00020 [Mycoplasmopsis gallinacea]|uniref:DUF262 domain-containing protein n=1 Tax=Mycoplasmopsis gallinacea TaxID=29556 RepID=A0A0D5ZIX4_9BACT|nr:hypothetical protein VO56_00020 [Mycoplasmopsis gallinacea]
MIGNKELLNKLELGLWNPRFEIINEFNFDYIKRSKSANFRYNLDQEMSEIANLLCENKESFIELFNSINIKWLPNSDFIEVVQKDEDKFIVIEGNRRVAVLKIIANYDKYAQNIDKLFWKVSEEKSKKIKVLKDFLDQIEPNKPFTDFELLESQIKVHKSNEEISNSLFKKHGIIPAGYQKWNELLLYLDIYYLFVNENIYDKQDLEAKKELVLARFNMSVNSLYNLYLNACWFIQLANNNFSDYVIEQEFVEHFLELRHEYLNKHKTLELLKKTAIKVRKDFDYKSNIDVKFNEAKREFYNASNYKGYPIEKIQRFVYKVYLDKQDNPNPDKKAIFCAIFNDPDFRMKTYEFIKHFWDFPLSKLLDIKRNVKNDNVKKVVDYRMSELEIAEKISKFLKTKFKKYKPIENLLNQIIHNTQIDESKFFLNAVVSAIRTISEYFIKLALLQTILKNKDKSKDEYIQEQLNSIFKICLERPRSNIKDKQEEINEYRSDFTILNKNDEKLFFLSFFNIPLDETNREQLGLDKEVIMSENRKKLFYNVPNEKVFSHLTDIEIYKDELTKLFKSSDICHDFVDFYMDSRSLLSYFVHNIYSLEFASQLEIIKDKIKRSLEQFQNFFKIIDHINYEYFDKVTKEMLEAFPVKEKEAFIY